MSIRLAVGRPRPRRPFAGSSTARLVCALIGHRWAGRPYLFVAVSGRVVHGRCTRCLVHVHGDTSHGPCPLPTQEHYR